MCKNYRIRDLREDNGLTQKEVAEKCYISKKTYERYENGERIPPIDFIIRCADLYGVSIDYLCERTDKKEVNK